MNLNNNSIVSVGQLRMFTNIVTSAVKGITIKLDKDIDKDIIHGYLGATEVVAAFPDIMLLMLEMKESMQDIISNLNENTTQEEKSKIIKGIVSILNETDKVLKENFWNLSKDEGPIKSYISDRDIKDLDINNSSKCPFCGNSSLYRNTLMDDTQSTEIISCTNCEGCWTAKVERKFISLSKEPNKDKFPSPSLNTVNRVLDTLKQPEYIDTDSLSK